MLKIDPGDVNAKDWHQYMLGAVAPRPIAFVSSIDNQGNANLAPYSFFNAFSSNPPILAFSVANKSDQFDSKDTLKNVRTNGEVVINVVSYRYVRQMSLTSIDYPNDVSEFEQAGFTPISSDLVKPFRVAESPISFECKIQRIIPLGTNGGAGNIVICDVLRLHIDENILDNNGRINPHKADLMGRMGRAYYVRASGEAVHTIFQARKSLGIGYQQLPQSAKNSEILTANNLGHLANLAEVPAENVLLKFQNDPYIHSLLKSKNPIASLHNYAKTELEKDNLESAANAVWLAQLLTDNNGI